MPKTARVSLTPNSVKSALWVRPVRMRSTRSLRNSTKATLLWIDDFTTGLEMYRVMFEQLGYRVLTASSGEEGLSIAAKRHVDLVVTDYEMPGMTGDAVAAALKALHPDLPIILFSGSTTVPFRALQAVDASCDKAGSREELLAAIHFLLEKKRPAFLQPPPVTQASDHRTVA